MTTEQLRKLVRAALDEDALEHGDISVIEGAANDIALDFNCYVEDLIGIDPQEMVPFIIEWQKEHNA